MASRVRMSSADASFLYLEKPTAPMHLGGIAIIDGEIDFEELETAVAATLARLPRLRQRPVAAPFHLAHPAWRLDGSFDLRRHLFRRQVAEAGEPGDRVALEAAVAEVASGRLRRDRPLWELHLIEGLEAGRSALISKIHPALTGNLTSDPLAGALFTLDPELPPRPASPPSEEPPAVAPPAGLRIAEALWSGAAGNLEAWSSYWRGTRERRREHRRRGELGTAYRAFVETLPDLARPLKRLPFNRRCSGERRVVWSEFSFAEARAVRQALHGTVNDVVLAAVAGAVAEYARHHGQSLERRAMRALVPVHLPLGSRYGEPGRLPSLVPTPLPLDIDDPARRLRAIRATTRLLKTARVAESLERYNRLLGTVPTPLQAASAAMAGGVPQLFNMVITHLPGPQVPLHLLGHRIEAYYPYLPTGYNLGLGCAVYSYHQRLYFGLTADVAACPDVELLAELLDRSIAELKAAAGVGEIPMLPLSLASPAAPSGRSKVSAGGTSSPEAAPVVA